MKGSSGWSGTPDEAVRRMKRDAGRTPNKELAP